MSDSIRFRLFAHSWISDWNHGNAHFLRGLARQLVRMGHEVRCYEELGSWSLTHLVEEEGDVAVQAIEQFRCEFPELDVRFYQRDETLPETLREELRDADVVLIHEWNEPEVANAILSFKQDFRFRALLHDTHHRAYTNAGEMLRFQLQLFDGVLAFGEIITRIYLDAFGMPRAWTFHEAADVEHFCPLQQPCEIGLLWIGNWGDEERTRELMEFLVEPAGALRDVKTVVHGVRYPPAGLDALAAAGIEYRGYLPNLMAPYVYAQSALSLHVPRRQYVNGLSGIPTIRMFEALACGSTLLCAPWRDAEQLFRPDDYVMVNSSEETKSAITRLIHDDAARQQIAAQARETIVNRHTCAHRAQQLVEICREINR